MARGYGTTLGGGTTDAIETGYDVNLVAPMSIAIKLNRHGLGGGSLGRAFEKRTTGAQVCQFFNNSTDGHLKLRQERVTTPGEWDITTPPVADTWESYVIVYDPTSTLNDPTFYKDGATAAFTETSTPNGVPLTNTDRWVLGNRKNDSIRNWDGLLEHFAMWEGRLLTAAEAIAVSGGKSPLFYPEGLRTYLTLVDDSAGMPGGGPGVFDCITNPAPIVTGTLAATGPMIQYPVAFPNTTAYPRQKNRESALLVHA